MLLATGLLAVPENFFLKRVIILHGDDEGVDFKTGMTKGSIFKTCPTQNACTDYGQVHVGKNPPILQSIEIHKLYRLCENK